MRKILVFLTFAFLTIGLAQAETVKVTHLWEKTFPANVTLAMDAEDTVKGPYFTGWYGSWYSPAAIFNMDKNGDVTEIPIDTTDHTLVAVSRKGRFILRMWYGPMHETVTPYRNELPLKIEVRDRTGRVILESNTCRAFIISDNGTLLSAAGNSIIFYDINGREKRNVSLNSSSRIFWGPVYLSDDGSRGLVHVGIPRSGHGVVVVDTAGKKVVEVEHAEDATLRWDGATLVTRQLRWKNPAIKKAAFYDREGKLTASWTLKGLGHGSFEHRFAFSDDGNYATVITHKRIALLRITPSKALWQFRAPGRYWVHSCAVGPEGKYSVVFLFNGEKGSKIIILNKRGRTVWQYDFPLAGGMSLDRDYLLITQGLMARLYKVDLQ